MSNNSRKRKSTVLEKPSKNNNINGYTSRFLIDGESPISPHPEIIELKKETSGNQGAGRHRSVDLKGLVLELIDDIYPPLICPSCFHTSDGRADADHHLKEKHHGEKLFSCVSFPCEQTYSSKAGLRYHVEHNHQITNTEGITASSSNKNNHKKTSIRATLMNNNTTYEQENKKERRKKPELSEELGKKLESIYPLHVCPACKKEFKRKTHVVNHLVEEHHGQEPYKCIVKDCKRTKAYATREGLVYHLINYHDQ